MQEGERIKDGPSGSRGSDKLGRLRSIVGEHRVCWEVLPEEFPVKDDQRLQIGFRMFSKLEALSIDLLQVYATSNCSP